MSFAGERGIRARALSNPWLPALAVLALSLFMRLVRLDLAQFDIDQVKLIEPAINFVQTGELPLAAGTTFSVGINIPPLFTYLLALPVLFTHSPVWLTACQAVVDAFGALFVYFAARQLAGTFAGVAGGACYAVLPDAILNARAITNGGIAPFLCAICLWGLVGFLKSGNAQRLGVALLALGLAVELHLTVAVFGPALVVAAALRWRDLRWRPVVSAAGMLALTLAPYAYLQLQTGFADVRSLGGLAGGANLVDATALEVPTAIAAGSIQDHFSLTPPGAAAWLVLVIVVTGLAATVWRSRPLGCVLALWVALPILATIRHAGSLAPHYYFGLFPAAALLGGVGLASLPVRAVGVFLLVAFLPLRVGQWLLFQQDLIGGHLPVDNSVIRRYARNGYVPSRYAAPYGVPVRFEEQALAAVSLGGLPVYVGPREGYDQVFRYLSDGRLPVVSLSGRDTTLLPPAGASLLLDGDASTMEWPLQRFAMPSGSVESSSGQLIYSIFRLDDGWLDRFNASLPLQSLGVTFATGPRLAGMSLTPLVAGRPSKLLLEWNARQAPPPVRLFARVVDGEGRPRSFDPDSDVFAATEWTSGAAVLSETRITPASNTPTGGYWLELGLYRPDGARLSIQSGGTDLRLGPIKVAGASVVPTSGNPKAVFGAREIALDGVSVGGDRVTLTWTALSKPRASYTVFVHALDAEGRLVAQQDGLPVAGTYPTSLWDAGESVSDTHQLRGSLATATRLELGLYSQPDQHRLPVTSSTGEAQASAFDWPL